MKTPAYLYSLSLLALITLHGCDTQLGISCEVDEDCQTLATDGESQRCIEQNCIPRSVYCSRDPDADGCRNECGGLAEFEDDRTPGNACGQCSEGILACRDIDSLDCRYEPPLNECGGCSTLRYEEDTACGPCGDGAWTCSNGALDCQGATEPNPCGGCSPLTDDNGDPLDPGAVHTCETDGGADGVIACLGPNSAACIPVATADDTNLCGGTETLEGAPTGPCGPCGAGRFECSSDGNSVNCVIPEDIYNACGGCSTLEAEPESPCGEGDLGVWSCSEDLEYVTCDITTNACGGTGELSLACADDQACEPERVVPGIPCGDGLATYCMDENTIGCAVPPINLCGGAIGGEAIDGGSGLVGEAPGTSCGVCGDGVFLCVSPSQTVCVGASEPNICGGCSLLRGTPGETCAFNHTWQCQGDNVQCLPESSSTCELNACGSLDDCCPTNCTAENDGDCIPESPEGVEASTEHATHVAITWLAVPGADSYVIVRDDVQIAETSDLSWNDTSAPPPTLTAGTAQASAGSFHTHVALELDGLELTNGIAANYRVIARNNAGISSPSVTAAGYRRAGEVNIEWQARPNEEANFIPIDVTGAMADHYDAPATGENMEYRARVSADGTEPAYSNVSIGYRATCDDGARNGDEEDTDCEGSCAAACVAPAFAEGDSVELSGLWMREIAYEPAVSFVSRKSNESYYFTAPSLPGWLSLDPGSGEILGTPDSRQLGEYQFELELRSRSDSVVATQTVELSVRNERVLDIDSGLFHACALLESGNIRCWGANNGAIEPVSTFDGLLGYAHTTATSFSAPPGIFGDVELSGSASDLCVGYAHNCALLDDGTVQCWGSNRYGQLGTGGGPDQIIGDDEKPSSVTPLQFPAPIAQIACDAFHTCVRTTDGEVYCWGDNRVTDMGASQLDGPRSGQLGVPSFGDIVGDDEVAPTDTPTDIGGTATDLCTSSNHSCAIRGDGKVVCWGANTFGQLGTGSADSVGDNETPALAGVLQLSGDFTDVVCSEIATCALSSTGEVYCWGAGVDVGSGVLGPVASHGDDETLDALNPLPLGSGWTRLALSGFGRSACAWNDTEGVCWGDALSPTEETIGDNESLSTAPRFDATSIERIEIGLSETFVIDRSGNSEWTVNTKDFPSFSQHDHYPPFGLVERQPLMLTNQRPLPLGDPAPNILGGRYYAYDFELPQDGDHIEVVASELPEWLELTPEGLYGEAPTGITQAYSVLLEIDDGNSSETLSFEIEVDETPEIVDLECYNVTPGSYCCAVHRDGDLRCWGSGGPDGVVEPRDQLAPTEAITIPLSFHAVGIEDECAYSAGSEVQCWGSNHRGRVGDGTGSENYIGDDERLSTISPLDTSELIHSFSASSTHRCVTTENGLTCFGKNNHGQLGRGHEDHIGDDEAFIAEVWSSPEEGKYVGVATGSVHTCATSSNVGDVHCWGASESLGSLTSETSGDDPVAVLGISIQFPEEVLSLTAGGDHSCALLVTDEVVCWGSDYSNALGHHLTEANTLELLASGLVPVEFDRPVDSIVAFANSTCASLPNETICWGGIETDSDLLHRTPFELDAHRRPEQGLSLPITLEDGDQLWSTANGFVLLRDGALQLIGRHFWECQAATKSCSYGLHQMGRTYLDVD